MDEDLKYLVEAKQLYFEKYHELLKSWATDVLHKEKGLHAFVGTFSMTLKRNDASLYFNQNDFNEYMKTFSEYYPQPTHRQ